LKVYGFRSVKISFVPTKNYSKNFSFDFSESGDELPDDVLIGSGESPASRSRKNKERRAERKMRRFLDVESSGMTVKSSMGSRRQRRLESVRILMSFADKDDICTDFSDLVPHTMTAFERLFLDEESMKVWNDFIERDEEEQRQILEKGDLKRSDGCGWFVVGGKPGPSSKSAKSSDVDGRKPLSLIAMCALAREQMRNLTFVEKQRMIIPLTTVKHASTVWTAGASVYFPKSAYLG
ncbi:hypothetical protein ANCCAN_20829, partial [Ancylostoma caninum]